VPPNTTSCQRLYCAATKLPPHYRAAHPAIYQALSRLAACLVDGALDWDGGAGPRRGARAGLSRRAWTERRRRDVCRSSRAGHTTRQGSPHASWAWGCAHALNLLPLLPFRCTPLHLPPGHCNAGARRQVRQTWQDGTGSADSYGTWEDFTLTLPPALCTLPFTHLCLLASPTTPSHPTTHLHTPPTGLDSWEGSTPCTAPSGSARRRCPAGDAWNQRTAFKLPSPLPGLAGQFKGRTPSYRVDFLLHVLL